MSLYIPASEQCLTNITQSHLPGPPAVHTDGGTLSPLSGSTATNSEYFILIRLIHMDLITQETP